jgi:hypothetical protein
LSQVLARPWRQDVHEETTLIRLPLSVAVAALAACARSDVVNGPINSSGCIRSGSVNGSRVREVISLDLAPSIACGLGNATVEATFASVDVATGTIVYHSCDAADASPAALTLSRLSGQ